jgi:hypothetical protein
MTQRQKLCPGFLCLLLAMACGGGGGSTSTPPPAELPRIAGFSYAPLSLGYGDSIQLSAIFSGGTGTVDQGVGELQSGIPVTVGPIIASRMFKLTVSSTGGQTINQNLEVTPTRNIFTTSIVRSSSSRGYAASAVLADGRILFAGGNTRLSNNYSFAECFSPATGTFEPLNDMTQPRPTLLTATTLADGRVLVAGGNLSRTAEIFDPAAKSFTPTGDMTVPRVGAGAIRLNNRKVLLTGGMDPASLGTYPATLLRSMEVFDPQLGTFQGLGDMAYARSGHSLVALADGRIMIIGGRSSDAWALPTATEIFDPTNNSISLGPVLNIGRSMATVICDPSNRIWVIGGAINSVDRSKAIEYFDPILNRFILETCVLHETRTDGLGVLLDDGSILICSGSGGLEMADLLTTERFDTTTKTIRQAGPLQIPHAGATIHKIFDGSVLVFGGDGYYSNTDIVEKFIP